jgi:hypothetical protein
VHGTSVRHEVVFTAGVPGTPRRQIDFKTDTAIGVYCLRAGAPEPHSQTPAKVSGGITRGQLLTVALSVAFDMAPAGELPAFHFKEIGEIAAHEQLQDEVHLLAAVVPDVQVLSKPLAECPAQE